MVRENCVNNGEGRYVNGGDGRCVTGEGKLCE